MAGPRKSLCGFLTQARAALRGAIDSSQNVTLVIGNESADLDSMSCSLLYAYLRSMSPPKNAFSPLYIPITNIPASDVQLRPEYLAVLRHANVEAKQLITLDDLPAPEDMQSRLRPEKTKWILVDHNQLQGQLGKIYSHRVAGVIDHHDDEGSVPRDTGDEPRILEKSGSCTSLIANYCRPAWDQLSGSAMSSGAEPGPEESSRSSDADAASVKQWDADVAKLGLASILIDTAKLEDKSKTTKHDVAAVEYLEAKVMLCPQLAATYDRRSFYEEIDAAKKDMGAMALQDILRKDYKQWDQQGLKLGVSSVVKPIAFLQQKAGEEEGQGGGGGVGAEKALLGGVEKFCRERGLDVYSVMTTSTSSEGKFQRELLVWGFGESGVRAAKGFARQAEEELGLSTWDGPSDVAEGSLGKEQWRKVWWQGEMQHSRKRVAPLLRAAMGNGQQVVE